MEYKYLIVTKDGHVAIVQIDRPKVLNALNMDLMVELVDALETLDRDRDIGCIVITGNDRSFAAGADINEMADVDAMEMLYRDQFARWDRMRKIKKPMIAAVSGFALGGGCELAMICDMIIASETAKFGQPEINIGVMPGAGGTQRLTRAIGKVKAMEVVMTGRMLSADEALQYGLVNKVVPVEFFLREAVSLAHEISSKAPVAVRLLKDAVLKSFDTTIEGGLEFERKNFYLLFASRDQKEGMKAFTEKRKPEWKGR